MRRRPFRVQSDVLKVGVADWPTFSGGLATHGLLIKLRPQWFEDVISNGTIRHCPSDARPSLKKGVVGGRLEGMVNEAGADALQVLPFRYLQAIRTQLSERLCS